jgi:hypothetical protein
VTSRAYADGSNPLLPITSGWWPGIWRHDVSAGHPFRRVGSHCMIGWLSSCRVLVTKVEFPRSRPRRRGSARGGVPCTVPCHLCTVLGWVHIGIPAVNSVLLAFLLYAAAGKLGLTGMQPDHRGNPAADHGAHPGPAVEEEEKA